MRARSWIVPSFVLAMAAAGCGGSSGGKSSFVAAPSTAAPPATVAPSPPVASPPAAPSTSTSTSTITGKLVIAGWLPYWSTTGAASVKKHAGAGLDEVNAFWYGFSSDGSLVAKKGARDATLVAAVHNNRGLIVPTVFDVDSAAASPVVMASAAARAKLLAAIVAEVDKHDYDGIDLDFEHLTLATRDAFSAWVAEVARAMHARGKIVSIAVLGKLKDKPAWEAAGALDFAALGRSVDRFKIMTYGVHGSWSGPGPIGPLGHCESTVKYALTVVPAAKVYLGVNFFGYDWPSTGKPTAVTYSTAQTRLAKSTAGAKYSAKDGESTFTYVEAGVTHTVWYADSQGLKAKAALAKKLGIGGLAAWAIGGEGADFFPTLDKAR